MQKTLLSLLLLLCPAFLAAETLDDFEKDLGGWEGKLALSSTGATSGSKAMEIKATGLSGWQQDLAKRGKNPDFGPTRELFIDVTVPQGSTDGAGFIEFTPIFSGPKDNWYTLAKIKLHDGLNKLSFPVDSNKVGTPEKFLLVLNSGKAIPTSIYVDNIRLRKAADPGTLKVTVKDQKGKAVAGATVAMAKTAATTDGKGQASFTVAADTYQGEVLGEGLAPFKFSATLSPKKTTSQALKVNRAASPQPRPVQAWVMGEKPLRNFDAFKIYGHNLANWNGPDPFVNPTHFQKLKDINAYFLRIPGGGYGNRWNWRDGNVYHFDGTVDWRPEGDWPVFASFFAKMGAPAEAVLIANIMTMKPQDTLDWIKDAKARGVKVRYVELGNEPNLEGKVPYKGKEGYFTHVENYVEVYATFAKAIRAAYPDIKLMGPCNAQAVDKECPDQSNWQCDGSQNEYWVQKFLRLLSKKGDLVDVVSFHSYPYWPDKGYNAVKAFESIGLWQKYLPMYQGWVKEYYPAKAAKMEYALTEYHMQVPETATTVRRVSGVWHAAFLAEYIKQGGTMAMEWDLNTMKPGEGGGHGMLDPKSDPSHPYGELAKYWIYKMMSKGFTGSMVQAQSQGAAEVMAWGSKDQGRVSALVINRSETQPYLLNLQVSGAEGAKQVRVQKLTSKEYEWSEVLGRPVAYVDPTQAPSQRSFAAPAPNKGWRALKQELDPMSVYLLIFE